MPIETKDVEIFYRLLPFFSKARRQFGDELNGVGGSRLVKYEKQTSKVYILNTRVHLPQLFRLVSLFEFFRTFIKVK